MAVQEDREKGPGAGKRIVTIVVNGREKQVQKDDISFEELVALAGFPPAVGTVSYTVVYHNGHGNKPEGSLVAGETVKVKDRMVFNVTATDRS